MDLAEKTGAPLVAILDTAGARLDEGLDAMNAYAMIAGRVSALSGVVPQVALVLGHCGGTASAIAGMSDIVVMSKNGSLFVTARAWSPPWPARSFRWKTSAGPRPPCARAWPSSPRDRRDAIAIARKVVSMLPANNMDEAIDLPRDDMNRELAQFNAIEKVDDVRDVLRGVADLGDIVELGEDFAPSMSRRLGKLGGATVGFIANQPAKDEGRLTVYGCKKAARFAAFCDCFSIPVVTVVDSMGMKILHRPAGRALPRRRAVALRPQRGQHAAHRSGGRSGHRHELCRAGFPRRLGHGLRWPGSVFSPVTATIAAQLLYADEMKAAEDPYAKRAELEQRYMEDVADAVNAAKQGYVDDVIEPSATRQISAPL